MAFSKADGVIETDPLALAEYAETLARIKPEGFRGEPTHLLERALSIDPQEPFALTLAGAAALAGTNPSSAAGARMRERPEAEERRLLDSVG